MSKALISDETFSHVCMIFTALYIASVKLHRGEISQAIVCCDFLLLTDVNESINNETAECVLPQLIIRGCFTPSHPSNGENRTRNRSEISRANGPFNV
jgi:hypothetical protein